MSHSRKKCHYRETAKALGLKVYISGRPCPAGHTSDRYVAGATCCICAKRRAQLHNMKIRGIKRIRDPAKTRLYHLKYRQTPYGKKAHAERVRINNHKRRSGGAAGIFTKAQIKQIGDLQKWRCANSVCRRSIKDHYTVDHIIALSKGGSSLPKNLQLLCKPCNSSKRDKHPIDWAQSNGLLL